MLDKGSVGFRGKAPSNVFTQKKTNKEELFFYYTPGIAVLLGDSFGFSSAVRFFFIFINSSSELDLTHFHREATHDPDVLLVIGGP